MPQGRKTRTGERQDDPEAEATPSGPEHAEGGDAAAPRGRGLTIAVILGVLVVAIVAGGVWKSNISRRARGEEPAPANVPEGEAAGGLPVTPFSIIPTDAQDAIDADVRSALQAMREKDYTRAGQFVQAGEAEARSTGDPAFTQIADYLKEAGGDLAMEDWPHARSSMERAVATNGTEMLQGHLLSILSDRLRVALLNTAQYCLEARIALMLQKTTQAKQRIAVARKLLSRTRGISPAAEPRIQDLDNTLAGAASALSAGDLQTARSALGESANIARGLAAAVDDEDVRTHAEERAAESKAGAQPTPANAPEPNAPAPH
jgi:hypothetical protein